MSASHWQLPASPLRESVVASQSIGLVALLACAVAIRDPLALSALYPLKAGALFMVVMAAAFGFVNGAHPFSRFGAANQITTLRAMFVALVAGLLGETASPTIAAFGAGAGFVVVALDGVDGWFARRGQMTSGFGARYDMEIDALLIMALAALAWQCGKAGSWILASGLLRYAFMAAGLVWPWFLRPLPASRRRQTICVVQVAGLVLVLLPVVAPPSSALIAAAALTALAVSFAIDTLWLRQHADMP